MSLAVLWLWAVWSSRWVSGQSELTQGLSCWQLLLRTSFPFHEHPHWESLTSFSWILSFTWHNFRLCLQFDWNEPMDAGRWSQPDHVSHGRTFVSLGILETPKSFKTDSLSKHWHLLANQSLKKLRLNHLQNKPTDVRQLLMLRLEEIDFPEPVSWFLPVNPENFFGGSFVVSCPVAVSFACTITFFFGVPPVLELASGKQKGSKRQSGIISYIPQHIMYDTERKALKEMGIGGEKKKNLTVFLDNRS